MIYSNTSAAALLEMERQRTGDYGNKGYSSRRQLPKCEDCGEPIYPGDDVLKTEIGYFCRKCVFLMDAEDLMDVCGYEFIDYE